MARARKPAVNDWVQTLGQQIGARLAQAIAEGVERELVRSIDVNGLARKLAPARRGRKPLGAEGSCTEAGCQNPVLAKGLCRSHYYRARYRAQKEGRLVPRRRKARAAPSRSRRPAAAAETPRRPRTNGKPEAPPAAAATTH